MTILIGGAIGAVVGALVVAVWLLQSSVRDLARRVGDAHNVAQETRAGLGRLERRVDETQMQILDIGLDATPPKARPRKAVR